MTFKSAAKLILGQIDDWKSSEMWCARNYFPRIEFMQLCVYVRVYLRNHNPSYVRRDWKKSKKSYVISMFNVYRWILNHSLWFFSFLTFRRYCVWHFCCWNMALAQLSPPVFLIDWTDIFTQFSWKLSSICISLLTGTEFLRFRLQFAFFLVCVCHFEWKFLIFSFKWNFGSGKTNFIKISKIKLKQRSQQFNWKL